VSSQPRSSSRYVALSLSRRWVRDFLYFSCKEKLSGASYSINIAQVAAARQRGQPRISWGAIFAKGTALTASRFPELKRAYMPFPWGHYYDHPFPVASIVVEREWQGEFAVFTDCVRSPEQKSLAELSDTLRALKTLPVEAIGGYRFLIRITRYPFFIRRLLWRVALYGSGRLRARYFGTFTINSIGSRDFVMTQATTPTAVAIYYGTVSDEGDVPIQIFFNHHILDGVQAHRLLKALGEVLNGEILAELSG